MSDKFDTSERAFAVDPEWLDENFFGLHAAYAQPLPDGNREIMTLAGHWDDEGKTKVRACDLGRSIVGIPMEDGRVVFSGLWVKELVEAFEAGEFPEFEEITSP